jgi:hypothetical protein
MPACNRDHLALLSKTLRIERDDAMPTCTATTASLRLFLSTLQWTTLKFRIGFSSIALLFRSFFCSSFVCIWKHSNGLGDTSAYKSMGALYYNYNSPLQGTRGDPFPCVIDRLEDRISGRFLYFPFYLGGQIMHIRGHREDTRRYHGFGTGIWDGTGHWKERVAFPI